MDFTEILRDKQEEILVFLAYLTLTIALTWPLITDLGTYVSNWGDPLLGAWVLAWESHALLTNPLGLFTTNTFYPWNWNTLAFAEHMISNQLFFLPVYVLTNNPILGSNVVLFLSFVLSGFGMYELVKHYTKNKYAAFVSGFIFAFSAFKFYHMGHLQLQTYQWMPLCVLYFDKFVNEQKPRNMLLFTLFFILQMLSSWYLGVYISMLIAFYLLFLVSKSEKRSKVLSRKFLTMLLGSILIISAVVFPFVYPYYDLNTKLGLTRTKDEVELFSGGLKDLFRLPSPSNLLYSKINGIFNVGYVRGEQLLFPGFAVIVLSMIGLNSAITIRKNSWKVDFSKFQIFYFLLAIFSLLMSLGIYENFYTPYEFFYNFVPGFGSMRVPPRFFILMIFSLSVLSGFGIESILHSRRKTEVVTRAIAALSCVLLLAETIWVPVHIETAPVGSSVPAVYGWLATKEGNFAVVELPTGNLSDGSVWFDARYMYFSTYHWKNIVNGYSGFFPKEHTEFMEGVKGFPTNRTLGYLENIGVRYVVLNKNYYGSTEFDGIVSKINEYGGRVHLINIDNDTWVVELLHYNRNFEFTSLDSKSKMLAVHLPRNMKNGESYTGALSLENEDYAILNPLSNGIRVEYSKGTGSVSEDLELEEHALDGFSYASFLFKCPAEGGEYGISFKVNGRLIDSFYFIASSSIYDSASPSRLNASIRIPYANLSAEPGESVEIPITVRNTGNTLWLRYYTREEPIGKYSVRLGWDVIDSSGKKIEAGRVILPFDVAPDDSARLLLTLKAPTKEGNYSIKVNMVDELVTWFNNSESVGLEVVKR